MEQSTNFGFNLPSRDTDDIVDVNQISDNFRIIDENMVSSEYVNTKILPYSLITKGEKNIFSWDTPDGLYTCPKGKFITFETSEGGKGKVPSDTIFTDSQCLVFVGSNIAEQDYRDKFFTIIGDFLNTDYIFDENGISIHQIIGTYAVRRRINIEASSGYEPEYWFDIPFSQKGKTLTTNDFTDEYKEKLDDLPNDVYSKTESDEANDAQNEKIKEVEEKSDNNSKAIATEIERVNNTFAPVIKNTLFGEAIVTKDVSPLEHTVEVKVSSDTIEDLTTININTAGKNLLSEDIFAPKNWRLVSNGIRYVYKLPTINGDCVFSYALNGTRVPGWHAIHRVPKGMDYEQAGAEGVRTSMGFLTGATNTTVTTTSMVLPNGYDYYYWICYAEQIDADLASFEYMQLEVGTDATEYEAYKGQDTYTPIADGTVKGVKSIYPSMTIFTDNDGVLINCEYNADTKKYIDNKFAELQALVLEG